MTSPDRNQSLEHEGDPRRQPELQQAPEEQQRNGVVVPRNPPVEIAEDLLVDEIEPKETVHLAL